jgi:class 3 adenylate cyclase/DNA-binding winged helix-turn-helix (wHTH) protein
LWRENHEVRLRRKTFAVLRYLVERPGELVTKAALLDAVWPDVSVSDSMPAISVYELRRALGDNADHPCFIETVEGRGYRFIAPVKPEADKAWPPNSAGEAVTSVKAAVLFEELDEAARLGLVRCPKCGSDCAPGARFCADCGTALAAAAAAASKKSDEPTIRIIDTSALENLQGERKTVTALFADIQGSTELEQNLDPEEARAIIDPALKIMIDAAQRYGGYVAQSTGDGIFAVFGAPVAYEDHPQRALYAALRMQEELKRYSDRIRTEGRVPIQVGIGVNTGEVVVRTIQTGDAHTEYVPVGYATSLAARMQALAPIGSITTTEQVRKLCEGYFELRALGPTTVRDVSEPIEVYEVIGPGPLRTHFQLSTRRGLTRFVGRGPEMDAIARAAEIAKAGHGQLVCVVAEPGVGKSRLFHEFKASNERCWMVLEASSVSYGKASAYLPVIDLLNSYFRIAPEDDTRTRREKVSGKVLTLERKLEDALPCLFGLLGLNEGDDPLAGMDARIRRERTLEAVKRFVLRESLNQPLMVVFEDLHWIDGETQAFLNLLADSIGTARLLLLVSYRPEYQHQWTSKTYYTQLRLDPLGMQSADEMLATLLGDGTDLAPLKRLIITRTEGNPLFMEELIQSFFDQGAMVRSNGTVKIGKSLREIRIPSTVEGIIAARIDRLPAEDKALLQMLAAIGIEFPLSLVRQVLRLRAENTGRGAISATALAEDSVAEGSALEATLGRLQFGELIYERPSFGDAEYTFKHALTHDVAYNSLLMERRRILHGQIGQAIEALFPDRLDDHISDLARHLALSITDADMREAEELFRGCIESARSGGAKLLELRSATSLARLLAKQGKRNEARALLAEIYNWFTEGFDTADLKDAKALLEELNQ